MKATEGSDSKYRPSIKAKPCTSDNKPFRIATETVCDAVVCTECLKPRCIYSIRRLKQDEFQMLGSVKEDILYVCGSVLFVETTALANICCVEPNVNCNSEISHHYFSCRKKFQECCYICGSFGDLIPISDERRRQFILFAQSARKQEEVSAHGAHVLSDKKGRGSDLTDSYDMHNTLFVLFNFAYFCSFYMQTLLS